MPVPSLLSGIPDEQETGITLRHHIPPGYFQTGKNREENTVFQYRGIKRWSRFFWTRGELCPRDLL
jgi:hypothetical protein